jgi:hypothetical protein
VRVSLEHYDGVINPRAVFDSAICSLSRRNIETLRDKIVNQKVIHYDGDIYQVESYGKGYKLAMYKPAKPENPTENDVHIRDYSGITNGFYKELVP